MARNVLIDEWTEFHQHSYPSESENLPAYQLQKVRLDEFEYSKIAALMQYCLFNTGWTLP